MQPNETIAIWSHSNTNNTMTNPNSGSLLEVIEIAKTLKVASSKALEEVKLDKMTVDLSLEQRTVAFKQLLSHEVKGKTAMANFYANQIYAERREKKFLDDLEDKLEDMKEKCEKCIGDK